MLDLSQEICESKSINNLDCETALFLEEFAKIFSSIADLSIPEQRETIKKMFSIPENQLEPIEKIDNKTIPGRHGSINIRLFSPKNEGLLPIIIYFHRGCMEALQKARQSVEGSLMKLSPLLPQ